MKNARYKKIIVTLANILKKHNVMQLQVDKALKIIFFVKKRLKQITEYNKSTGRQKINPTRKTS